MTALMQAFEESQQVPQLWGRACWLPMKGGRWNASPSPLLVSCCYGVGQAAPIASVQVAVCAVLVIPAPVSGRVAVTLIRSRKVADPEFVVRSAEFGV